MMNHSNPSVQPSRGPDRGQHFWGRRPVRSGASGARPNAGTYGLGEMPRVGDGLVARLDGPSPSEAEAGLGDREDPPRRRRAEEDAHITTTLPVSAHQTTLTRLPTRPQHRHQTPPCRPPPPPPSPPLPAPSRGACVRVGNIPTDRTRPFLFDKRRGRRGGTIYARPTDSVYIHTNSAATKESGQGVRSFAAAAAAANSPVTLPDLPYGYGELEPVISGGTDGRGA